MEVAIIVLVIVAIVVLAGVLIYNGLGGPDLPRVYPPAGAAVQDPAGFDDRRDCRRPGGCRGPSCSTGGGR